jgi:hypothetical protein
VSGNYEIMRYWTDRLFLLVRTASPKPDDGILKEIGWGAATSSLALASLAWFLVGLFVN